jgi:hypothetical protein
MCPKQARARSGGSVGRHANSPYWPEGSRVWRSSAQGGFDSRTVHGSVNQAGYPSTVQDRRDPATKNCGVTRI